jgi:predicted MPP superfamily phosphohydrolase
MLTHNKDNTNPYHAKFISYHNYRHERVSKFIRDKINPHKFDFEPGDIIMATKTFNPTGVQNIIVNSEHGLIERKCKLTAYIVFVKVFGDLHYYEVTKGENEDEIRESYATALGQEVVVEPMDYFSIRLQDKKEWIPIQPLNIKRLKQIGQHIIDNGHFYDREDFENNKWKAYYDLFDFFAQIQYGYSSTAHKAQGSTYEVVFVHISDIISAKHMTDLQKLQAIYVALTRAKYKIYVFYDEKNT